MANSVLTQINTQLPKIRRLNKSMMEEYKKVIKDAHLEIAREAKQQVRNKIRSKNKVVTRGFLNSVSVRLIRNSETFLSQIYFNDSATNAKGQNYAGAAILGRPAGRVPNYAAFYEWARIRFGLTDQKDIKKAAYFVVLKIKREGTGTPEYPRNSLIIEESLEAIKKLQENLVDKAKRDFIAKYK